MHLPAGALAFARLLGRAIRKPLETKLMRADRHSARSRPAAVSMASTSEADRSLPNQGMQRKLNANGSPSAFRNYE
jgi:hypothetical protein